jgi:hypothetical protein
MPADANDQLTRPTTASPMATAAHFAAPERGGDDSEYPQFVQNAALGASGCPHLGQTFMFSYSFDAQPSARGS